MKQMLVQRGWPPAIVSNARAPGRIFYKSAVAILAGLAVVCLRGVEDRDSRLSRDGARLMYDGNAYSGLVLTRYSNGALRTRTPYRAGLKHGEEQSYYPDGAPSARGAYVRGRRQGVHRGWHTSGALRFQTRFLNDHNAGESFSWYEDGRLAYYARYDDQGDLLGLKQWRADGRIFMNYIPTANNRRGLYGGRLCYTVRSDANDSTVALH